MVIFHQNSIQIMEIEMCNKYIGGNNFSNISIFLSLEKKINTNCYLIFCVFDIREGEIWKLSWFSG